MMEQNPKEEKFERRTAARGRAIAVEENRSWVRVEAGLRSSLETCAWNPVEGD
jgi:hypothetical protein